MEKLKEDEAALRAQISGLERRLEGVPQREQEFAGITRDYQASKDLYESLLKRLDDAQLAESMETDRQGERFRILEAAIPPVDPSAPNRTRLLILGLMLAMVMGALAIVSAEQVDQSFHTADDLREFTSIPVLATISNDYPTLQRAMNEGSTSRDVAPRSTVARDITALAEIIAGASTQRPRGIFGRLFARSEAHGTR